MRRANDDDTNGTSAQRSELEPRPAGAAAAVGGARAADEDDDEDSSSSGASAGDSDADADAYPAAPTRPAPGGELPKQSAVTAPESGSGGGGGGAGVGGLVVAADAVASRSEQAPAATATAEAGAAAAAAEAAPSAAAEAAAERDGGASGGGGGGGGAEAADAGAAPAQQRDPAAPAALERVLEQLGIFPTPGGVGAGGAGGGARGGAGGEPAQAAQYRAVALAARADSRSLALRMERQARLRAQAEHSVHAEAEELARALHRLNYLCREAESVELLGAAQEQIHFLLKASKYVAATAETMGALRLEERMSGWMEASLNYADSLRQQLETVRTEHEELRRVLSESGASLDLPASQGSSLRRPLLSNKLLNSPRRASIAVPSRPTPSTSPGTGVKDQGRLSLAFIPGTNSHTTAALRTVRRPLSTPLSTSESTVGGSKIDGASPSPSIPPEDCQPLTEDTVKTSKEEDASALGNCTEAITHNINHPQLSAVGLPDPEEDVLCDQHVRHRENAVIPTVMTLGSSNITSVHTSRFLHRTAAAELVAYIWPPDFLMLAQNTRWLVVRLLILAAVWCIVQAFMSPADACEIHEKYIAHVWFK